MSKTIGDIEQGLGIIQAVVIGNRNLTFDSVKPIFEADDHSLTWIRSGRTPPINGAFIICSKTYFPDPELLKTKCFIKVDKPEVAFMRLTKNLFPTAPITGISPYALISPNTRIGHNATIREFTSIGFEGLGHIMNEYGELENMAHLGYVEIGDNVEIANFVNIDCGTLSATRIGNGSKIDHHVHISHNVTIGRNTIIVAHVVLCGSCTIGDNCWIGAGALIRESIVIGNNVCVGMGAVVVRDIPDGETWAGNPARKLAR